MTCWGKRQNFLITVPCPLNSSASATLGNSLSAAGHTKWSILKFLFYDRWPEINLIPVSEFQFSFHLSKFFFLKFLLMRGYCSDIMTSCFIFGCVDTWNKKSPLKCLQAFLKGSCLVIRWIPPTPSSSLCFLLFLSL